MADGSGGRTARPRVSNRLVAAAAIIAVAAAWLVLTLGHMDRLNAQIHGLRTELTAAGEARDKAAADLKGAQDAAGAAQTELAAAKDRATALGDQVTALQAELATTKAALAAQQAKQTTVEPAGGPVSAPNPASVAAKKHKP